MSQNSNSYFLLRAVCYMVAMWQDWVGLTRHHQKLQYCCYLRRWEQGIVNDCIHGLIAAKAMDEVMR